MANLISIGQIIDKTTDHYIAHFKQLMLISLWALIIPLLVIIRIFWIPDGELVSLALAIENGASFISWLGIIFGTLVALIVIPALTIWIYINLIKATDAQSKNKTIPLKTLRDYGWKNFFSYIWVAFLKTIITVLPVLAIIPGLILIGLNIYTDGGAVFGGLSIIITFIGLVIAAIFSTMLTIELEFVAFARLLGEKKGMSAISGSRGLVKERFWSTLIRILVPKLIFGIIMVIILAVLGFADAFAGAALLALLKDFGSVIEMIIYTFLVSGVSILMTPLFIIPDYYLYDSLLKTR
ncbi:hypothetical protein KJ673_02820 [Patescibacteria group bacterium]|nr:hypothetical protein [Patescibacteria group bacterium]MCG2687821.1 hypothetical protein [Candidatus Parcubacteria bacterium]